MTAARTGGGNARPSPSPSAAALRRETAERESKGWPSLGRARTEAAIVAVSAAARWRAAVCRKCRRCSTGWTSCSDGAAIRSLANAAAARERADRRACAPPAGSSSSSAAAAASSSTSAHAACPRWRTLGCECAVNASSHRQSLAASGARGGSARRRRRTQSSAGRRTAGVSTLALETPTTIWPIRAPLDASSAGGTAASVRSSRVRMAPAAGDCAGAASSDIMSTPM
mmetsp:Transcript_14347/g.48285  ORF Transcript_14347/g.48285 Transcript_14347/m.48285 type:complete len:228 (-) Transcript_14347:193-876(-)